MSRRTKRTLLAAAAVGVVAAIAAPVMAAELSSEPAGEDVIGTTVHVALKAGTKATFSGLFTGGGTVTATCTGSSFNMPVDASSASPLGPVRISDPTFTGCTDNLGGTDTITTNGTWTATFIDAANDETTEGPDQLKLVMPKAGATATSTAAPAGCVVTFSPSGTTPISKPYDDKSTYTITGQAIAESATAQCPPPGSAATFNATYVISPGIHDAS